MLLLNTAYLAPVSYYAELYKNDDVMLEKCENYVKQSYRNRCRIATANGVMDLTIPVESGEGGKIQICDVKISYSTAWQQQHWRAIEAAYRSSAFFEYYQDDFIYFYEKQWTFLWDFNLEIQEKVLKLLDIEKNISFTEIYENQTAKDILDFRDRIHPKKSNSFKATPYYQVFENKFGFIPDLSIIDLIFNMGNETQLFLQSEFS